MKIGKLPEPVLIRSVLKQVKHRRKKYLWDLRLALTVRRWRWERMKCW